jgi:two-component system, LytTR family, response regulator
MNDRRNSGGLRVLVVDDEKLARDFLVRMLSRDARVQSCFSAPDISQAAIKLRQNSPDVIFLDIQMPGGSGFEFIEKLAVEDVPVVIFTTAYPQFAPRAFDVQACDYLLKPFDEERLAVALGRAAEAIKNQRRTAKTEKKVTLTIGARTLRIAAHEISWMAAEGNYVRIHSGSESLFLRSSLGKLQREFRSKFLIRVHRSSIVNILRIKEMNRNDKRCYSLVLSDGTRLKCSRRCQARLRLALKLAGTAGSWSQ